MVTPLGFAITSERSITTRPAPGVSRVLRVITYQLPAQSPRVLLVREEDLPDRLWLQQNPGQEIPAALVEQGAATRRARINAQLRGRV